MSDLADPRFLDERLAHWAETKPDDEAITYLDRTWTWAQWNDRVRRLAGALTAFGVKRGDVVAFLDKNHPACLELTFAAASLGVANAIINFRPAGDEMDYVLNDSGAKVLIVGAELKAGVDKIRDKLPNVEQIIEVTPEGGDGDEYEALLAGATAVDRSPDVEPDAVCIIMYSSGTTGRPQAVALPLLRAALEAWPNTDFIQAYGLTELCGVISHLMPEDHRSDNVERMSSAGTLVPNAEVRVVNPDTLEDVPQGEQGELWFRSKQLMKGYHNKPEATAEAITEDGWFRTGDIGRVDDGGYIFVEDRLKDMIISGGGNIYSIEVERVLAEHPAVVEVAVIGVPHDTWGEVVKAVVSLEGDATEEELIA